VALQYIVTAASWLEIVVGGLFLAAPGLPCLLVFGARLDPLARFAGIALMALGIACLPSRAAPHGRSFLGLFGFNVGAAVLFAWVGIAAPQHGILALPAAVLHAGIAAALLPPIRSKASPV
jgi:hypothetical protein